MRTAESRPASAIGWFDSGAGRAWGNAHPGAQLRCDAPHRGSPDIGNHAPRRASPDGRMRAGRRDWITMTHPRFVTRVAAILLAITLLTILCATG